MADGHVYSCEPEIFSRMRAMLEMKGYKNLAKLDNLEIWAIVSAYIKMLEEIKSEEAAAKEGEKTREKTEQTNEKDAGWFPGDCCD